jgi:TonB family protein
MCGNSFSNPNQPRPDAGGARPGHKIMRTNLRLLFACFVGIAVLSITWAADPLEPIAVQFGLSKYVAPHFPTMAIDQSLLNGVATVAVAWDETGRPTDIVVLRASHRLFGEALKDAVQEWRRGSGPLAGDVCIYEVKFVTTGAVTISYGVSTNQLTQPETDHPLVVPTPAELDAPLKAVVQPMPSYPRSMQNKAREATVVVHFFVDESGRVRAPTVHEATAPEFAREALDVMRQWQFDIPRKAGRPVVTTATWSFQFGKNS